jgi:mycothiol synthase
MSGETLVFRRRAFVYERDIPRLQHFLARMRQQVGQAAYFQFGDLLWRIHYPANRFDPITDLPIWEDADGTILGFGFFLQVQDNPEFYMHPALYDAGLGDKMIAWAVDLARAQGRDAIETSCIARNQRKAAFLSSHGFTCIGDPMLFQERRLDVPIPDITIPEEYTVAQLRTEIPELSVAGSSPFPRGAYLAMRRAPGYRPDLDVKAYRGDTIAAGCICWLDEVDGCGELEPVGTHLDHRRRGLAAACITQALRALRDHGATTAYVRTGKTNRAAVALYEKIGFETVDEDLGWRLAI